eukprot:c17959_g1_i1.p1 GENE.c17959_g1_i1~~c17959_g1_i1.p1  ORF type:complete len:307 (+),score=95.38 c17959_g1_i1:24-923(+)
MLCCRFRPSHNVRMSLVSTTFRTLSTTPGENVHVNQELRISEYEVKRREYAKELRNLRKDFVAQVERERKAAKEKKEKELLERVAKSEASRELKQKRSDVRHDAAIKEHEELVEKKRIEHQLKLERNQQIEAKLSTNRKQFVSVMRHIAQNCITLENLDERLNTRFFENPTPWKFEYIPFCAPDHDYWKENINPLYAERQVRIERLQDILDKTREDLSKLTPHDLLRLQQNGVSLQFEDNPEFNKRFAEAIKMAGTLANHDFEGSTIINESDDDADLFNDLFEDEDSFFDFEDEQNNKN